MMSMNCQTKFQEVKMKKSILFILLLCGFSVKAQFDIPDKPRFQTSVYDYASLLNSTEKKQLEEKLVRYADSTTTQIVVITIDELKGESIGILTPRWGQAWGIGGSKANDNGVIVLVAKEERKIWISAGYGVEDRLTAGITGELVRNVILPEFKAGSYYMGLTKGADAIFEVLKGKYKGSRKAKNGDFPVVPLVVFVLILVFLIAKNKNNGNSGGSRGLDLTDIIILSSLGRSSGGGYGSGGFGSGSSGGFGGGFGGGGFSGGGAGGSW